MNVSLIEKRTSDFTEIYNEHYALLYSVIHSRVNNPDDVQDICQEVFSRFYEKLDEVENPRKWLLGALRNVVYEYYRRKGAKDLDIDEIYSDVSLTFVNGFKDTRLMIEEALDDIDNFEDEQERVLFELIAVHNYTYKEVGKQLGFTERQVRYKYSLIGQRLIQYFKKRGISSLEDLL